MNMRPHIRDKKSKKDVDESSDTYDTIDWLLKNVPNNNGKAGVYGVSYLGFFATMSLIDAHPALLAVSPQAPMSDLFMGDDGHHLGAYYLNHAFTFFGGMGMPRPEPTTQGISESRYPTPDGYDFFLKLGPLKNIDTTYFKGVNKWWTQVMEHETYDQFWQDRSVYANLKKVTPAVLVVGGWYDVEDLLGAIQTYARVEKQNPGIRNNFVMGPWGHGWWSRTGRSKLGDIDFGSATGEYFQENIQLPFYNHYLKNKGNPDIPEAAIFETGSNQWRSYDAWPPKSATEERIYFNQDGQLSFKQPPVAKAETFDSFISDPAKPVPYTARINNRIPTEYMVEDQRFAARRPGVLVYESEILADDITMTGPIGADLYVSTTGTDADWIVKVIDVFPDSTPDPKENPTGVRMGGYQMMVRGDGIRGKFRNSFEKPEPFKPGEVTRVKFELPDIQHRFLKGHRIMVQVQSSWFPLIDRNPQTFCQEYKADKEDFKKAEHRVYRSQEYPSSIVVKVLK